MEECETEMVNESIGNGKDRSVGCVIGVHIDEIFESDESQPRRG